MTTDPTCRDSTSSPRPSSMASGPPPPPRPTPTAIPPRTSSAKQASMPSSPTSSMPRHRSASGGSGEWLANRLPPPPPPPALPQDPPHSLSSAPFAHKRYPSSPSPAMVAVAAAAAAATASMSTATATTTPPCHLSAVIPSAVPSGSAPVPPPDADRYRSADLDFTTYRKTWTEEKDRIVRGPFDYLNDQPGKDFRTRLIAAFDAWLEVPADSLGVITRVVDMLHTASLLVDDVEDGSSLRRGLPVAHSIFGVPQTINSANYVYFLALQELLRLRSPRAVAVFSEELVNLHRGQGMDLFWRDSLTCPTEEDYLEMVGNKTGGLFRLGIKLMQAESPHEAAFDCVPLVNVVGLIFQIRDDLMNLSSATYSTNKGLCEDLTEGKFSFPIIHSVRADPTSMQLLSILGQKTTDADVKRYAVAYMQGTGSFDYTRRVLAVLIERARGMVDEVDAGRGRAVGLHAILDWAATE